jgi:hypothetical protein
VISSGLTIRSNPVVTADGCGGAIIAWSDTHNRTADIFAQRVDRSGRCMWQANGRTISNAANDQVEPQIVTDQRHGAIIAWLDKRDTGNVQVFAARIDSNGIILPVELSSFTARRSAGAVLLEWSTASEMNNNGFSIERAASPDGPWSDIGFVPGTGNTTTRQSYTFVDPITSALERLPALHYRLRQRDFSGSEHRSKVVAVALGSVNSGMFLNVSPNPVSRNQTSEIEFFIPSNDFATIRLYDLLGRYKLTLFEGASMQSRQALRFSPATLQAGVYIFVLTANREMRSKPLVVK